MAAGHIYIHRHDGIIDTFSPLQCTEINSITRTRSSQPATLSVCDSLSTSGRLCLTSILNFEGQIPSNLLLTRSWIKPHYYVPVIEVLWTIATFASSQVSTVNHLYAVRFFLGLFEAGSFLRNVSLLLSSLTDLSSK